MRVTLIQYDVVLADKEANRRKAEEGIRRGAGSDLYLLPEMFSTGFIIHPEGLAEEEDSDTILWMKRMAREMDAAICGSLAMKVKMKENVNVNVNVNNSPTHQLTNSPTHQNDVRYFNRMYFVRPDGSVSTYDKAHLFVYGGEGIHFTAGTSRTIVEWRGVKILLQVCYDLRFPMWSRNSVDKEGNTLFDMIVYSAEWPTARQLAWETLPIARAIENQCFVAACNRVGHDGFGDYNGASRLIHPYGHVLAEGPLNKECEITGEIDMDQLLRYREKFPTLNDIIWTKDYC